MTINLTTQEIKSELGTSRIDGSIELQLLTEIHSVLIDILEQLKTNEVKT